MASIWQRGIVLAFALLCAVSLAHAQDPADPQRTAQEQEADKLFLQGEGRMKVAEYESAIAEFRNVMKRYPLTDTRYRAQFRMADALVALKKEPEALATLQSVVKEEAPEWSPKALMQIGDIYANQQKYTEAFRSYKQVIADYPNSFMVDRAHYAIGALHFKLGHFELAAEELDKVGTAYASRVPDLQRVYPGEPLYVRLTEPNLVATKAMTIPVTLTAAKSGDKESAALIPEAENGDHFGVSLSTALGSAKPGDGILQVYGNDLVALTYKSRYIAGGAVEKTVTMPIASNGRMSVLDSDGNEVRGVVITDMMTIVVSDPDRDVSDKPDTITVDLKTKRKDTEALTLTESGAHTGVFRINVKTAQGTPTPNNGIVETDAELGENSATQYDDNVKLTYQDEQNLAIDNVGPRKVETNVALFKAGKAEVLSPEPTSTNKDADLAIKTLLYKGRSLSQIAATYRDLGMDAKATLTFRDAAQNFQELLAKYPNSQYVEDAMYGLFQNYVAQDQYESAISIITQITRKFPQSSRAGEALFELAALHVKREEYEQALGIYQSVVQRAKGTTLAEDAQYAICTTYIQMYRPKASSGGANTNVDRSVVTDALMQFVSSYPQSERAPEALWQLVRYKYDGEDFNGADDAARRMVALYPDNVMTGRVLLLQAMAQYKLRKLEDAMNTLQTIIANYGSEQDQAEKLLGEIKKRFSRSTTEN